MENDNYIAQDLEEINNIKEVLYQQRECWNKGDIDGFMQGYWKSENLIFTSAKYKTAYGWEETNRRYKESYPTKTSMGKLNFEILNVTLTSKTTGTLKGAWELKRDGDNPNGLFWLDMKKFDNSWLIIKDSTLSYEI
jgi:hypothetical protein